MKAEALHGVLAPVTTPFDAQTGDVAPVVLRSTARELLARGLHGIVVSGSTGEGPLLDGEEQARLVEWLRDVVPEDRWLVAGTGAESTRATIRATERAAAAGADAALVRPPAYFGPSLSPAALVGHFLRVADASPIPLLVYNIPKHTHVMLQDGVLRSLAEHERVVGFKDSSGDLKLLAAYRAAAPRLRALVGTGSLFYPALEMGADGGILAVACFAAETCATLYRAFRADDRRAAGAEQERLVPLAREIVGELGVPGVKAAMDLVGLAGGPVRPPLVPLDARQKARVADLLARAGLQAAA
ncbi:MAG TPA: dihydrodipicolinate synthase family protein [Gemmatimonadales bacterium]|nr:dihydrodipicolinate synthase family protein [Gemmatimonadales bacterium]